MIVEETVYTIKCDDCGDYLENEDCDFYPFYSDSQEGIRDEAQDIGWVVNVDGKDYCPGCAHKRGIDFELIDED